MAFGVEKRFDRLENVTDDPTSPVPAVRYGRPDDRAIGLDQGARPLHRAAGPAGAGRAVRGSARAGAGLSLLRLRSGSRPTRTRSASDWAPVQDIKFRGSYQRAVRAANVVELFTAQGFNLFDLPGDPCGADLIGTAGEASRDACIASGVPAAVFDDPAAPGAAGQPCWPVQLPAGRRPGSGAGDVGHVHVRRHPPAAVPAEPGDVDRLLRHRDRGHDLDGRARHLAERLLLRRGRRLLRSHRSRPGQRLAVAAATATWSTSTPTSVRSSTKGVDLSLSYTGVEMGRSRRVELQPDRHVLDELTYVSGVDGYRADRVHRQVLRRHSAASRTRNGGITSASAGRRRGTSTCRSPGVTTTA